MGTPEAGSRQEAVLSQNLQQAVAGREIWVASDQVRSALLW